MTGVVESMIVVEIGFEIERDVVSEDDSSMIDMVGSEDVVSKNMVNVGTMGKEEAGMVGGEERFDIV